MEILQHSHSVRINKGILNLFFTSLAAINMEREVAIKIDFSWFSILGLRVKPSRILKDVASKVGLQVRTYS